MTVTNKPDHRGERDISVKTIARGMPGVSGVTVVTTLVCSFYSACEAAGASSARHSLRPLFRERDVYNKTRAKMRGEIAKLCPDVIAIYSSFAVRFMDCFASARNDRFNWLFEI